MSSICWYKYKHIRHIASIIPKISFFIFNRIFSKLSYLWYIPMLIEEDYVKPVENHVIIAIIVISGCASVLVVSAGGAIAWPRPALGWPATSAAARSGPARLRKWCPSITTASSAARRVAWAVSACCARESFAPLSGCWDTPTRRRDRQSTTRIQVQCDFSCVYTAKLI